MGASIELTGVLYLLLLIVLIILILICSTLAEILDDLVSVTNKFIVEFTEKDGGK